ncbi:hypothetical protein AGMMS50229_19540 [Campylobacterota bacterium]|nr:hypothetical protein AGMMS50229_19540 [Campylobacterota bacterium]
MNSQPAGGAFPFALSFTGGSWGTPVYHVSRNGNGYTVDTVGGANEAGTLQITGTAEIREQGGGKFISFEYFIDYTDTCDGGLTFTYSPGDPIQAAPGNTNASWESPICYYD